MKITQTCVTQNRKQIIIKIFIEFDIRVNYIMCHIISENIYVHLPSEMLFEQTFE